MNDFCGGIYHGGALTMVHTASCRKSLSHQREVLRTLLVHLYITNQNSPHIC